MKISIGIDLHKSQFTTCMLSEDRTVREPGMYPTTELGYREFLKRVAFYEQEGYEVAAAVVESTGNTRYFRNKLLQAEIGVTVVNTLKFKIVNESGSRKQTSVMQKPWQSFCRRICFLNLYFVRKRVKIYGE